MAESGTRFVARVICVLIMADLSGAAIQLEVTFLEDFLDDYNLVSLRCLENGTFPMENAEYLRNGTDLTSDQDNPVTILYIFTREFWFNFTRAQEGLFSCRRNDTMDTSPAIPIAAAPEMDYSNMRTNRYVAFRPSDSFRDIVLSCPIQPVTLQEQYSVMWEQRNPNSLIPVNIYDLTVTTTPSLSPSLYYQCTVTIEHSPGVSREYNGSQIYFRTLVLATLDSDLEDTSVMKGCAANFTCQFSKGTNDDVDIYWTVDGDCSDINRYINTDSESILLINDTSSFAVGEHLVQCVLLQTIPETYRNDPSFLEEFDSQTEVMKIATLTVIHPSVDLSGAAIQLEVSFPEEDNFNRVSLRCLDNGTFPIENAEYLRNGTDLTSDQGNPVTMVNTGTEQISFTFTRAQEGLFSCRHNNNTSPIIPVAAAPQMDYSNVGTNRYITFHPLDSSRDIEIFCPFGPGALQEQYRVVWRISNQFCQLRVNSSDLRVAITPSLSPSLYYQCRVTIQHSPDVSEWYNGSQIYFRTLVLATLDSDLEDTSVVKGNAAHVTCQFSKGTNDDVDIYWTVDGVQYDCDSSDTDNITCTNTDSESILLVNDTGSLEVGDIPVQCVLLQTIPEEYRNDRSFLAEFNSLTEVTRTATLTVLQSEEGDLRLIQGPNGCEGHLQVFVTNNGPLEWRSACDRRFGMEELQVACRQIRCPAGNPQRRTVDSYGGRLPSGSVYQTFGYSCEGSEGKVVDCPSTGAVCDLGLNSDIIALACLGSPSATTSLTAPGVSASSSLPTSDSLTDTPTPTYSPDPSEGPPTSSSQLSNGVVAGIIIAVVIAVVAVILAMTVAVVCVKRRKVVTNTIGTTSTVETVPLTPTNPQCESDADNVRENGADMHADEDIVQQLQHDLSNKNMIFPKRLLQVSEVVGQGESGLVYRGYFDSGSGKDLVAIKTVKALSSPDDKVKLLKEVSVMVSFQHPNVMPLLGLCYEEEMPLLIMPFMSGGNVLKYMRQNQNILYFDQMIDATQVEVARKTCLDMCYQVSKGMSYLAKYRFVHRDLAARNCMLDRNGVVKVADFGLTEDMYGTKYFHRRRSVSGGEEKVPIRWMAPESIQKDIFSEASDVWSFGVTCWEVFTCGRVPYAGVPALTLLRELTSGHRLPRPSNAVCSDDIWNMMMSCWAESPHERPHFSSLVDELSLLLDTNSSYLKLS